METQLVDLVTSVPRRLRSLAKAEELNPKKLKTLVQKSLEAAQAVNGAQYRKLKPLLSVAAKTLEGLGSGLAEDDLDDAQVLAALRKLSKVTGAAIRAELDGLGTKQDDGSILENRPVKLAAAESLADVERIEEELERQHKQENLVSTATASDDDEKIIKRIQEYEAEVKKLPTSLSVVFDIVTAPVVPIAEDYTITAPELLKRASINAVLLEGYPVLGQQLLLAVDSRRLDDRYHKQKAIKDYSDYVIADFENLLAFINNTAAARKKLEMVSHDYLTRGSVLYMWVMFAYQKEALRKASNNKTLTLWQWAFPEGARAAKLKQFDTALDFGKEFRSKVAKLKRTHTRQESWVEVRKWLKSNKLKTKGLNEREAEAESGESKLKVQLDKAQQALDALTRAKQELDATRIKLNSVDVSKFKGAIAVDEHEKKLAAAELVEAERLKSEDFSEWDAKIEEWNAIKDLEKDKKIPLGGVAAHLKKVAKVRGELEMLRRKKARKEKDIRNLRAVNVDELRLKDPKYKAHEEARKATEVGLQEIKGEIDQATTKLQGIRAKYNQVLEAKKHVDKAKELSAKELEDLHNEFLLIWKSVKL